MKNKNLKLLNEIKDRLDKIDFFDPRNPDDKSFEYEKQDALWSIDSLIDMIINTEE